MSLLDKTEDGWFHEEMRSFAPDKAWTGTLTDEQIKAYGWVRARRRMNIVIIDEEAE